MGGSGPNRPKQIMREKRERGKERNEERQQDPTKRKGTNIRCNTDQKSPQKRTRHGPSTNEAEKQQRDDAILPRTAIITNRKHKQKQRKQRKLQNRNIRHTKEEETGQKDKNG